jgi:hypothetical protein
VTLSLILAFSTASFAAVVTVARVVLAWAVEFS